MNTSLLAIFTIGMFMHNEDDDRTSRLGSMLVAGSIIAVATAKEVFNGKETG